MYIAKFLTDYDDSLTGELNIDPLGQLVIWSSWGQHIFHSCITSIANDVRQYTLNLLHHSVMRQLLADDQLHPTGEMAKRYPRKEMAEFRAACLIHLENIYIYSMLENKARVQLSGVQGINKARLRYTQTASQPVIPFGHGRDSELLTNQLALGTNGRYKSPMMNMQFFNSDYRYDLSDNKAVWQSAERFIASVKTLKTLKREALNYLQVLMRPAHKRALSPELQQIPPGLKRAYINAFSQPDEVGASSREFWLERTGLNRHAAGALYQVLEQQRGAALTVSETYQRALALAQKMPGMDSRERETLGYICQAEPFLSCIERMFAGLRRQSSQTLAQFAQYWQAQGLDANTLARLAAPLAENGPLLASLPDTPKKRFQDLLTLAQAGTLEGQVRGLLAYHQALMATRGQSGWLTLAGDELHLQVAPQLVNVARDDDWVNSYYLPQFRHWLNQLWGSVA